MQSEAAGRAGDPSHQSEDPPPAGLGDHGPLAQTNPRRPAVQVMAHNLARQPGAVGGEAPRRHMVQPDAVLEVVDLARYFTGRTPSRLKATTTYVPGQHAVSPMIYTMVCEYEPEAKLMSTLHFNNIAPARPLHHYLWYLDGTDGSALITRVGGLSAGRTELIVSFGDDAGRRHVFDRGAVESGCVVWHDGRDAGRSGRGPGA